jgi:beta-glucosidase-like glycosyl hydrolase
MQRAELERLIGAVLVPEVRVPGTYAGHPGTTPSDEYLRRFPPACVIAFGRTPAGPVSPRPLLDDLRARLAALGCQAPIAACDLEQGAGLHFPEGTLLPPALALAAAAEGAGGDQGLDLIRGAASITAREARALGVELVLAPVADVNTRHDNPIIAVRSFGDRPAEVAERARVFAAGLAAGGAGACAKHFPGHGDTDQDSHLVLPRVGGSRNELEARELLPFRALVAAGIDAVMVAHLDVPALTGHEGRPASLSRAAVEGCLRRELGFGGAILTDALDMGALDAFGGSRFAAALEAGCDGLLALADPLPAAQEILRAVEHSELDLGRLGDAAARVQALCRTLRARPGESSEPASNRAFALDLAARALCARPRDEARGAWERRAAFAVRPAFPDLPPPAALAGLWREPRGAPRGIALAVAADVRAGAGRYGLDPARRAELGARIDGYQAEGLQVALLWFASPQTLPREWWQDDRLACLVAFAPSEPMASAVAAFLGGAGRAGGSLPARLG